MVKIVEMGEKSQIKNAGILKKIVSVFCWQFCSLIGIKHPKKFQK
jgi:hypothetical protein